MNLAAAWFLSAQIVQPSPEKSVGLCRALYYDRVIIIGYNECPRFPVPAVIPHKSSFLSQWGSGGWQTPAEKPHGKIFSKVYNYRKHGKRADMPRCTGCRERKGSVEKPVPPGQRCIGLHGKNLPAGFARESFSGCRSGVLRPGVRLFCIILIKYLF